MPVIVGNPLLTCNGSDTVGARHPAIVSVCVRSWSPFQGRGSQVIVCSQRQDRVTRRRHGVESACCQQRLRNQSSPTLSTHTVGHRSIQVACAAVLVLVIFHSHANDLQRTRPRQMYYGVEWKLVISAVISTERTCMNDIPT